MSENLKIIYMAGGAEYTIWPLQRVIYSKAVSPMYLKI